MILYGRDLSPFTRRVAIWCELMGHPLERRQIMVSGPDYETLKGVNPLGRVPALVLDDGSVLLDSGAMVDWLEDTAPDGNRLIPATGDARRAMLQNIARAQLTAEKGVSLVYERVRRPEEFHWGDWIARVEGQITAGLTEMEAHAPESGWHSGAETPQGDDINVVIAYEFVASQHPQLTNGGYPKLARLSEASGQIPAFAKTRLKT